MYSPNLIAEWKHSYIVSGPLYPKLKVEPETVIMRKERAKKTKEKSLQPLFIIGATFPMIV